MNILQYNIRGFWNNYSDIPVLDKNHIIDIFSLQETHLKMNHPIINDTYHIIPKSYQTINKRASQGVAILVKKHIPFLSTKLPSKSPVLIDQHLINTSQTNWITFNRILSVNIFIIKITK